MWWRHYCGSPYASREQLSRLRASVTRGPLNVLYFQFATDTLLHTHIGQQLSELVSQEASDVAPKETWYEQKETCQV